MLKSLALGGTAFVFLVRAGIGLLAGLIAAVSMSITGSSTANPTAPFHVAIISADRRPIKMRTISKMIIALGAVASGALPIPPLITSAFRLRQRSNFGSLSVLMHRTTKRES